MRAGLFIAIILVTVAPISVDAQVLRLDFPHPFRLKTTSVFGTNAEKYELWSVGGQGELYVRTAKGETRTKISKADLNALLFVNERTVYVLGNGGEILYSNDRGVTWTTQTSNTKTDLESISCVDASTCWIVGSKDGLLLRGGEGKKWTQELVVNGGRFKDVDFVNRSIGYAVGWDGLFLKTVDGGDSWVRINIPSTISVTEFIDGVPNYEAVLFDTVDIGCVAGWDVGTGFIACTRDGGRKWQTANVEATPRDIVWTKDGRIFVVDVYGENLVSRDLGKTWRPQE